jgi:serine/threonine protein kinase
MLMDKELIQFSDENRQNHTLSKGSIELFARGGTSDVYKIKDQSFRHLALKIYRNPEIVNWDRIIYQITNPIDKIDNLFGDTSCYAWPVGLITENKRNVGIVLPYIDRSKFITLDNWVEGHLIDKLTEENKSLSRKLLLLKNVAGLVEYLHKKNCSVVDLKPANFLIHKSAATGCMLDCDSLRIVTEDDLVYPATHASPGYIAPEALVKNTPVGDLGIEQDLFAFAVMAFQVLNYGIHPFQGIISEGINAPNQDDKVKQKLYPYGSQPRKRIRPLPQSVHNTFSKEVGELFHKAFVGAYPRPSAKKWVSIFGKVLTDKALERCQKFPNDPTHIRFEGMGCPACSRAEATSKISPQKPKPKAKKSKSKPATSSSSSSAAATPKWQPQEKTSNPALFIGAVIVGLIFMAYWMNVKSEKQDSSHYEGASNSDQSNNSGADVRPKSRELLTTVRWRYDDNSSIAYSNGLNNKSLEIAVVRHKKSGKLAPIFTGNICSLGSSVSYSTTNERPIYEGKDWLFIDPDQKGNKSVYPKYFQEWDKFIEIIKYSGQVSIAYLDSNCHVKYETFSLNGSLTATNKIP